MNDDFEGEGGQMGELLQSVQVGTLMKSGVWLFVRLFRSSSGCFVLNIPGQRLMDCARICIYNDFQDEEVKWAEYSSRYM